MTDPGFSLIARTFRGQSSLTFEDSLLPTAHTSPEVMEWGCDHDAKSDVYSFGVFMLGG